MQVESRERTGYGYVSTGRLPSPEMVKSLVSEAYERFKSNAEGSSSDVYEALARAPSDLFGVCVVGTSGNVYAVGDTDHPFSIMSVSKPFVFALVCQSIGGEQAREKLGANSTGLPFNSLAAIERSVRGWANQPYGECRSHRDYTRPPATGFTTLGCPARAESAAGSSPSLRGRADWELSPRRWTARETASRGSSSPSSFPNA